MADDPGESFVIETVLRPYSVDNIVRDGPYQTRLGPGDDAAWLNSGEVVTTDVMIEGVHFDHRLSPEDLGWKLVAVNASDVGAMGARPTWALLTLCLPRPLRRDWVIDFARGLHAGLDAFGLTLVGGDTTRSPGPVVAGLTAAGRADRPVTRGGGHAGDDLWVTGALGEAAAGFLGVDGRVPSSGLDWLRRPRPPVAFGAALGEAGLASAMMDLSDGLASDLPRLCARSGVGARIDPALLPRGPALAQVADPLPWQVAFGDDYQLLFAAPPDHEGALRALAASQEVRISKIGTLTLGRSVELIGLTWPSPAFSHFEGSP